MKSIEEWNDRDYWFWLLSIPGLYRNQLMVLLEYFKTPRGIFEAPDREFDVFIHHQMSWVKKLRGKRSVEQAESAHRRLQSCGGSFIQKNAPDWPMGLSQIADPPYGLFYRGALPKSDIMTVAIVGARSCTEYGRYMAEEIGAAAARAGMQVISGMALGIDGFAQKACVNAGGRSFGILGCGVDECYPREHIELFEQLQSTGGIISEYPCGTVPLPSHFPLRNRLISGLSDAVIVVEAREKSGSLITADMALDQGRDIYAVPGRSKDVLSGGCNKLLAAGAAALVVSTQQLIRDLEESALARGKRRLGEREEVKTSGIIRKKSAHGSNRIIKTALAPDEELVYSLLDLSPEGFDSLMHRSGMGMSELTSVLAQLMLKGLAEEIGQNQFMKR